MFLKVTCARFTPPLWGDFFFDIKIWHKMASARYLRLRLRLALALKLSEPRLFRHAHRALTNSAAARAAHGATDMAVQLPILARGVGVALSHALVLAFKQRPESLKQPSVALPMRRIFPGLPLWVGATASPFIGIPVAGILKPKEPRSSPWPSRRMFMGATFGVG